MENSKISKQQKEGMKRLVLNIFISFMYDIRPKYSFINESQRYRKKKTLQEDIDSAHLFFNCPNFKYYADIIEKDPEKLYERYVAMKDRPLYIKNGYISESPSELRGMEKQKSVEVEESLYENSGKCIKNFEFHPKKLFKA